MMPCKDLVCIIEDRRWVVGTFKVSNKFDLFSTSITRNRTRLPAGTVPWSLSSPASFLAGY
jgi:hypothetical protein